LDILYGGLGIGKLQFLIKKILNFYALNFFQYLNIKTLDPYWIRIGIQPKMLDRDPDDSCLSESIELIKDVQASLRSYDQATRPPPSPLSLHQVVSLSQSFCVSLVMLILGGGGQAA
jgi:hypothetical protein